MFDFHEKRKLRKIFFSKPVIGLIFLCAFLLSFSVYDRYVVSREIQAKLDARYEELEELEMRAATLSTKVSYLEDERGIEEELRNRFDVAKEGEQVVILVDKRSGKETGATQIEPTGESGHGFWYQIRRIFNF